MHEQCILFISTQRERERETGDGQITHRSGSSGSSFVFVVHGFFSFSASVRRRQHSSAPASEVYVSLSVKAGHKARALKRLLNWRVHSAELCNHFADCGATQRILAIGLSGETTCGAFKMKEQKNRRTEEQKNERTKEQKNERMKVRKKKEQKNKRTEKQKYERTKEQKNERTN